MIFAEMTAPGRGGISTIAVLDMSAAALHCCGSYEGRLSGLFRPAVLGKSGTLKYRRFIDSTGVTIDEVVTHVELLRSRSAADDRTVGLLLEIHCHGGPASVMAICGRLEGAGFRRVGWREFQDAAGLGVDESAVSRSADAALVDLPTMRAVELVLRQRDGIFERAVREIILQKLSGHLAKAESGIAHLLDQWELCGRRLSAVPRVAIIGAPNVGKSSLLNALAGHDRVIVDESPGTTRDIVGEQVSVHGLAVELLDTAGLRESGDVVERAGVVRALEAAAGAELRLCLVDLSRELTAAEREMIERAGPPCLVVGTKSDLEPQDSRARAACAVCVSSKSGLGLDELCCAILQSLGFSWPADADAAVPFAASQASALAEAMSFLRVNRAEEAAHCLKSLIIFR